MQTEAKPINSRIEMDAGHRTLDRLAPSHESVEQFNMLLNGQSQILKSGATKLKTLDQTNTPSPVAGSFLTEVVLSVGQADASWSGFRHELKKRLAKSDDIGDFNANLVESVVFQKAVIPFEFLGLNMMGNKSSDISEEVQSLTRGR